MTKRKKILYTWLWIGGGYNQHYAFTKKEAMEYATTMCSLKVDLDTFKRCTTAQEQAYWDNFPAFD